MGDTTIKVILGSSSNSKKKQETVSAKFNIEDFRLDDLDSWVRTRFSIDSSNGIKYLDPMDDAEIIPTKAWFTNTNQVKVEIINQQSEVSKASKPAAKPPSKPPSTPSLVSSPFFYLFFLALTTSLFFASILYDYNHPSITPFLPNILSWCQRCDRLLADNQILAKPGVSLEAFIATVCWSSTYLFIRRLFNPENVPNVLLRFAADSFFGGLAAGFSVFLKHFLMAKLM